MGLIEDAVGIVRDVSFDILSEDATVTRTVTYTSVGKTTYDPVDDENDSADVTDSLTMIRTPVTNDEIRDNETVLMGDRKYLMRTDGLSNLSVGSFRHGDTITDGSEVWRVVEYVEEPTNQLVKFYVRRVTS